MSYISEAQIEQELLTQLKSLGYELVTIRDHNDLVVNFRKQLARLNQADLDAKKGAVSFSDAEFTQVLNNLEQDQVYEAAKCLRDQCLIDLDNGQTIYLDLLHRDPARNIFQVAHQIKMERDGLSTVEHDNRYDITILVNGLPLVSIELKRPGVELSQALAQINRYRKHSMRGLFTYTQLFVISNGVNTQYCCNQDRLRDNSFFPIPKNQAFFWSKADNELITNLSDFAQDFLAPAHLVEMITKFMIIKETQELMVMRPYQIYAVKAAQKRILVEQQNGYVFACTGSGKTLTSFKLAQLLRDESSYAGQTRIAKIIFLVDRKDLDDQTIGEYNAFEPGCVDNTNSTAKLVAQLKTQKSELIVTTIQKLACALNSDGHQKVMNQLRAARIVFIIDECHRSQFGKMHADIKRHFKNALYIGFTGTPIFDENKNKGRTTADVFHAGDLKPCLHRYMIKDAIRDHNVLPFSVEHKSSILGTKDAQYKAEDLEDASFCSANHIDRDALYHDEERLEHIARDIMERHDQKTQQRSFTAMFAVDSIATLGRYYDLLRQLNTERKEPLRIAAIFSFRANEDYDDGESKDPTSKELSQELLARCIKDYNETFGTNYGLETFDGYRQDIARRMKQADLPQIDLLLVVDMMLTGFDARPLNTLYLDKTLRWHGLLQAYSRTNRIDTINKQSGQIVTYRNIKQAQDNALRLFSGNGDPNEYLLEGYEHFLEQWQEFSAQLKKVASTPESVAQMESEDELMAFIEAFKKLPRILGLLMSFSQFNWQDLAKHGLNCQEYNDYKSRYVDLYNQSKRPDANQKLALEVDYEIDLVCIDHINVAYILRLLEQVRTHAKAQQDKVLSELQQAIKDSDNPEVRLKSDIIETFVVSTYPNLDPNTSVQAAYQQFEHDERERELQDFAEKQGIAPDIIAHALDDYEFKGYIPDDELRKQLRAQPYNLGFLQLKPITNSIKDFILQTALRFKDLGD
ncbi:MAG: type I restriction endonuclease subunit R [Anaerobiospirillum sp.]|nr:type I restriction endonuclease subunit R [Anaerobiospirillum sp.]